MHRTKSNKSATHDDQHSTKMQRVVVNVDKIQLTSNFNVRDWNKGITKTEELN